MRARNGDPFGKVDRDRNGGDRIALSTLRECRLFRQASPVQAEPPEQSQTPAKQRGSAVIRSTFRVESAKHPDNEPKCPNFQADHISRCYLAGHPACHQTYRRPDSPLPNIEKTDGSPDALRRPGVPKGTRTPVSGVRGRRPRPLDDGDAVLTGSYLEGAGAGIKPSIHRRVR